ncbi:coiled-coil and C2 domain-containing protein 1B isoform X1 [Hemibagrus wyckioides]|uniref:coiled-coil and C2 domain-containing protein 1B isoform X1 n=2 Tax=Hemibagrus wyckioides TaxID=337641 RepID=UPI00266B802A|nr:coiled-coil and C2 domain-containing protein 1B isoform X1 [Hemibagrus wyckioides]
MFGMKNKRPAPPKGQGAAAAKQMGLFLDFNPEDMMDMSENVDDPDLEAEFAAIVGKKTTTAAAKAKKNTKAPLPMEDIEKMTEECMKDLDNDDDDDDLEDDEDLLAELQEVVGEEEPDSGAETATSPGTEETGAVEPEPRTSSTTTSPAAAVSGSVEHTLQERIVMYNTAINNAKAAGESAKARRYDRGLKTLQSMLASVRKGGKIKEAEIPPPVASGNPVPPSAPPTSAPSPPEHQEESDSAVETTPVSPENIAVPLLPEVKVSLAETSPVSMETAAVSATSRDSPSGVTSPEEERIPESPADVKVSAPSKVTLLETQRQYRTAALRAKQAGDLDQAKTHMKSSKSFDAALAALERGESVDISKLPPPLSRGTEDFPKPAIKISQSSPNMQAHEAAVTPPSSAPPSTAPPGPVPPKTILEALEQRMAKYKETCDQAKANGDERKARMYDRIVKQYQSAVRSHKAGRAVNYEELPVPPGFPPIPGQEAVKPEQGLAAALESANKLASNEAEGGDDDEEEEEPEKKSKQPKAPAAAAAVEKQKKQTMVVPPTGQHPKRTPSPSPERSTKKENPSSTVTEQVEMLEARRKQYMKAALQAKQRNDLEQAKVYLRTAKSLEPLITAARSGKHLDLSKVPSPPADEDEDFIVVHHSEVEMSERAEEVYTQLSTMLKEQYEKCLTYSKQFSHMGNITETTKFENMAERCKKSLEILKLAQNRGLDPPKHHFEERTYRTVRIFPELSSTDMVVMIVKGMNLPAPHGVQASDLDAYVRFEFPFPSSDQPQRHKTAVMKNTNSPEYNQSFTLNINRNHRGFRRLIQSKGLKLEVFHKGGFLRSDKPVGTAHIKLDKLETESEVREIVEVMDGRKPTGGRVEVRVRLREPLSGQDMQTVTERWLVLDQTHVSV